MPPDTVSSESLAPGLDRWLRFTVRRPLFIVACALLLTVLAAISATRLHKDTSANAYIEPDNPALLYREKVIETFGLKEPIVIAVVGSSPAGILSVDSLRLVRDLVERVERIPNVDPDRIVSVVSQSSIRGGADTLEVSPLLPAGEIDALTVTTLREALDSTTLYDGTLVARDRSATVIVAELLDERQSAATYQAVLDLTRSIAKPGGIELHVAGAGAITGYFSTYIDRDAGRLVPFTAIAVSMVLFCAFFSTRSSALPMLIAAMTVIATLGAMAASGVAFFAITNGMVVVLIGISVAEPMHVSGEYYALLRNRPTLSNAELVRGALRNVWWPIALTSVTTLVGFLSLWLTSTMPPIRYFGLFGAFGVLVAWVLTVSLLPAAMALLPKGVPKESPSPERAPDAVSRFMFAVGGRVIRAPRTVLAVTAILSVAALSAASLVRVDHARIENFNADEPIYIADREINRVLAGTNQLDIVIESSSDDGILMPEALRRIDALQTYVTSMPQVGGATSIVDYVKRLHRAMLGDGDAPASIPSDEALIAQLMLTYQASAPPTEFQSMLDSSGRTALVRAYLRADRWSEQKVVVESLQAYLEQAFPDESLRATLTGRVMLDYEWVQSVASGHALSVIVSTLSVLGMCIVIFRSVRDGLLCLAPLVVSVLGVYAAMGLAGIWLGVATSMFAAVAIGLGIDFSIHMISRARKAARRTGDTDMQIMYIYQTTGRAVLFNAAAVGLGFGIITLSAAPPVRMFGVLVAIAIVGAFIGALTVLPALLKILGDRAARRAAERVPKSAVSSVAPLMMVVLAVGLLLVDEVRAESASSGEQIMRTVAARAEGQSADRIAHIELIDKNGGVRLQIARAVRKNFDEGRRMAVFYQAPANIRGTSFLVYDYADASKQSDQWLYLPALRKVRRVPAADRGDYFLGTDLTYDEIRNDNRVTLEDWRFVGLSTADLDGVACVIVDADASSDQVARELGYGRARWWVDPHVQMARRIEYWDRSGARLKTVDNLDVANVDGVWMARQVEAINHKTGHRTRIRFDSARFNVELPDGLFTQQQMERGP